ncbi:putative WRKY transcription factor 35 [Dichanthelium oligosanthes]|uniref:Putative WRKY transcription factor 35 n=1 Tax=Dichanthelium oligosanthes TaxID=888268 RepID=A0A1E5VDC2_9POAL|nr:putative WRKY transcription factor 35 [Dichanthelium oligosanthes]
MCDYFLQRMEGDQAGGGDLTDILRAGGVMPDNAEVPSTTGAEWQLQGEQMLFAPPPSSSDGCAGGAGTDVFGDPFSGLGDPFSSDYASGADFLDTMPDAMAKVAFDTAVGGGSGCGGGGGGGGGGQLLDMSRKPLLPRGMQMPAVGVLAPRVLPSPLSPRAIRPYPALAGDMVKLGITAGQVAGCAIDAAVVGMQMSSPRAAGGIKRRKNQARKVVCIPAPTAAGGRPTGEVVPSDLWAWRKYGQKPIKGSPYPRGYYRCSSSKGCSARKQVERSRTDPNMLVITYTSEHNHPWPTQRNALAGSTRNHHGKNSSGSSGSKSSQNERQQQPNVKEEPKDPATTTTTTSTITTTTSTSPVAAVKEEAFAGSSEALGRAMDTAVADHSIELMDQVFGESYKPMIPEAGQPDDFFSDLAVLESDPMSLIFSKEYMEAKPSGGGDRAQEKAITKELDPFDMLDWSTTTSAGSSFEQGKRGC